MSNTNNFEPLSDTPRDGALERAGTELEKTEPLILGLDTATEARSLAVVCGSQTIAAHTCEPGVSNSSTVLGDIDRVLRAAAKTARQIDLFAVSVGPGSFTGLRAGIATVKALAKTLRKRAVGVQTLHAIAHAAMPAQRIVALMPAGRGEVFAQFLSLTESGTVREHQQPIHVAPGDLISLAKAEGGSLTWAGCGASKYQGLITEAARVEGIRIIEGDAAQPSRDEHAWTLSLDIACLAEDIARLAFMRIQGESPILFDGLKAVYVRPADARLSSV